MKVTMMRKLMLVFALSAVVVMTAPVLGARSHAADDKPIAGLRNARSRSTSPPVIPGGC
jgi:hypothetical protein